MENEKTKRKYNIKSGERKLSKEDKMCRSFEFILMKRSYYHLDQVFFTQRALWRENW